ncbi:MAG: hypothetical protein AVDCRST_MAG37-1839, partial [uncultured Rubrobacteraceae bacterium]
VCIVGASGQGSTRLVAWGGERGGRRRRRRSRHRGRRRSL